MVPTVLFPPLTPLTDHVTEVFEVPLTLALNCCLPPVLTLALVGLMLTPTLVEVSGLMVMERSAVAVLPLESVTINATSLVPAFCGVPEI